MSATPPVPQPPVEGSMFLFRSPVLLNQETHGNMGIKRPERPFGFAADIRAVPLTLSEVISASRHFPIIFSAPENPLPLAVVGIIDDENLFVDTAGNWDENAYVPGYLRRYPFALASDKGSDPENPRMAMIVDEAFEGISNDGELKFFEEGKPSAAMKQAMDYCKSYEQDRATTNAFAKEIAGYDLLAEQVAQFTPEGATEPKPFAKYVGIEESRLKALSDERFLELRKRGVLPLLYAQLTSMANWRLLMERRARRHSLSGAAVLEQVSVN